MALVTIGVEGEGGVRELLEGEGGGGVDPSTRVVGGDILGPSTSSQDKDQHHRNTADSLYNITINPILCRDI